MNLRPALLRSLARCGAAAALATLVIAEHATAECVKRNGEIEVDGKCVCTPGTAKLTDGTDLRCLPICPPGRVANCRRHEMYLMRNEEVSSAEYCDCLPEGDRWDIGLPARMNHCPPFTGEVLQNGDCVCPAGQTYHLLNGHWRCRPPCELPKRWDCSRQLTSLTFGRDYRGTPDEFCQCELPSTQK